MATAELKKILSHGAIYAVGALLARVVSFVMMPLYTRALSPAEYGVVDLLDTTAAVIVNLANVAITYSVMRFYYDAKTESDRGRVISSAMAGLVLFGTVALTLAYPLASPLSRAMFHSTQYASAIHLMAATAILYGLIEVPMTFIRALERPWLYLFVSLGRLLLGVALNVVLVVWLRWGVMGVVWANVLTCLVSVVCLAAFTLPKTGVGVSRQALKSMLVFGLPFIPGSLAMLVLHNGDRYILSSYRSLSEIGLYSLGYKLGMIISYAIAVPFANVWSTRMYTMVDQPGGMKSYAKVGTYYVFVLLLAWVGLASAAPELVGIAASREFASAALFVPLISLGYTLRETSEFWKNAFLIKKQTNYLAWIQPLAAVVNLLVTWLLVRSYGAMGAAWATVITFVFLLVLTWVPAERMLPTGIPYGRVAIAAAVAGGAFGLAKLVPSSLPLALSLLVKIGITLLFPVALVAFGAVPADDRAAIFAAIRRIRGRESSGRKSPPAPSAPSGSIHP